MATPTIAELRRMSERELVDAHDRLARDTQAGVTYYLDELARRDQSRQTEAMLKYTRWIIGLTIVVTVATIVNVAIACRFYLR